MRLIFFSISESYLVSLTCCSCSNPVLVLVAFLMTLGVTSAVTVYAFTTKSDFTVHGGKLFIIGMSIFLFVVFACLFGAMTRILNIFICLIVVVCYGIYLVYDI